MNTKINEFEVMAPVGSRESLAAAIQAGADSVYFGIGKLNMRSHSANHFTIDDLREIAATCNEHGIKTYLTVNTVIYDNDIPTMKEIINAAKEAGISAVIASDVADGSLPSFVAMMNQKAQELGCTSTSFTCVHGLYDYGNVSSAHDLALIASA